MRELRVVNDGLMIRFELFRGQVAHVARGATEPELSRLHDLARREKTAGTEHCAVLDHATVHDDGAHSNERLTLEPAAVDDALMANEHVVADERAESATRHMNDGPVLDIGARADADAVDVAASNTVEPEARALADLHIADHVRAGRDERAFVDCRQDAAIWPEVPRHCHSTRLPGHLRGLNVPAPCERQPIVALTAEDSSLSAPSLVNAETLKYHTPGASPSTTLFARPALATVTTVERAPALFPYLTR